MQWRAAVVVLLLATAACGPRVVETDVPAILVAPTPAVQAELIAALTSMLGRTPLTIAPDALTRSSLLTLERPEPRGAPGRAATGRSLETPERFRLVVDGGRCVLVHETGTQRSELSRARCVAERDNGAR